MTRDITPARLIAAWFALVSIGSAVSVVAGIMPSIETTAWLVAFSALPPTVLLLVWRAAPGPGVAAILHGADAGNPRTPGSR